MNKCNNCFHRKVCINSANYKNAENCRQYVSEKDVQEVKHGHWIETEDFTMIEQYAVYEYECSECGAHAHYGIDNYCYHCGAKMDGDSNDN